MSTAAAAILTETRPQDAARVGGAVAGSATEAPSLGLGGLADVAAAAIPTERVVGEAAGLPPGRYSAAGALGGVPEVPTFGAGVSAIERRLFLAAGGVLQPYTGAKMAVGRPDTAEAIEDCKAAGFDLEITSRQVGFRRAGVIHPITPTLRRSEDFTLGELALLRAEPLLIVRGL